MTFMNSKISIYLKIHPNLKIKNSMHNLWKFYEYLVNFVRFFHAS